ncbi:MAG: hypothetical protein NTY74_14145 [Ignavibacteriae bacterium]|nr:hypothetical protein [Ignavibacteriota bacterium]
MQTTSMSVGSNGSEGIRLLQPQSLLYSEGYGELALLSKRKARAELRIGNDALNKLIEKGKIKIIQGNKRDKIPYVSIQEYVYGMKSKEEWQVEENEIISEEESVAMANKILREFNKGGI